MAIYDVTATRVLPVEPGVYRITGCLLGEEMVQLDERGQWWPYPYFFSGWRNSELITMGGQFEHLTNTPPDVPEIRNPETADRLRGYIDDLRTAFPEVPEERIAAFARKKVLGEDED